MFAGEGFVGFSELGMSIGEFNVGGPAAVQIGHFPPLSDGETRPFYGIAEIAEPAIRRRDALLAGGYKSRRANIVRVLIGPIHADRERFEVRVQRHAILTLPR